MPQTESLLRPTQPLRPDDLLPIGRLNGVKDAAELLGVSPHHMYRDPHHPLFPYCYWDGETYHPLTSLMDKYLERITEKDKTLQGETT